VDAIGAIVARVKPEEGDGRPGGNPRVAVDLVHRVLEESRNRLKRFRP